MTPDDTGPYMVHIWYAGGSYQTIDTGMDAKAAIERAKTITDMIVHIPGGVKVTVTDADDFTVFQWEVGKGVTYPTREQLAENRKAEAT